jgi:hypothetical protein
MSWQPAVLVASDKPHSEAELVVGRRLWGLMMVARTLEVAESILHRQPVMVRSLNAEPLRRALRGGQRPDQDGYITVTVEMLDAVDEAGPLEVRR